MGITHKEFHGMIESMSHSHPADIIASKRAAKAEFVAWQRTRTK
jgi:hypothetical protein